MKFAPVLALAGLAQAAHQFSSNGVHYSVVMTKNGTEVPVKMGPPRGRNSTRSSAMASLSKRGTVTTTGNWCGLADNSPPSGTWKSVVGGWVVPDVSLRSGQTASEEPSICQWVGIDGYSCSTGLIQGGTVSEINSDGVQENYPWWEFVPDALQSVDMTINTGDTIFANVTMTSTTDGTIEVINESAGESFVVTITGGPGTLCGATVEWVLEDLSSGGGFVPFAQFPDNSFTDPVGFTTTGEQVVPVNADQVYLYQETTLCQASFNNATGEIDIDSTA